VKRGGRSRRLLGQEIHSERARVRRALAHR
jgi:hypothetical protein